MRRMVLINAAEHRRAREPACAAAHRFVNRNRLRQSADVHAEIGETVAKLKSGREKDDEYILVVPIGLGALDIALGRVAYERVTANESVQTFRFFESTPS